MNWTPADYIEAGKLALNALQFLGTVVVVVGLFFIKRDMDGRFSQLIELVGRVLGAPSERRIHDEPVEAERRSKNK